VSLAALLGVKSTRRFFERAWPDEPFVAHGSPARLRGLGDVKELKSVEALARVPCRQLLAQGQHLEPQRFGNVAVLPEVAPSLLKAGLTLYFNEPQFTSRSLWKWVHALERDLSLARGVIRPSVFLSSPGRGARMHFDSTESFVVQLRGRKAWTFARNEHVTWAPVNYLEGEPVPPELQGLVRKPMRAPKKRTRVVLKPGSVLFLPRGWWHSTETLEDSMHLDLLAVVPTWADVLRPLVEAALTQGTHWRTPAIAPQYFAQMVDTLRDELLRVR
jgi:50S ribosomal protein L16 3-hydroxylase